MSSSAHRTFNVKLAVNIVIVITILVSRLTIARCGFYFLLLHMDPMGLRSVIVLKGGDGDALQMAC